MSRALVVVLVILTLAGVGALELYGHMLAGIRSGGPVPLRSVAPKRDVTPPSAHAPRKAIASPVPSAAAPAASGTSPQTQSPRILGVSLSSSVVTGGQVVTGTVQTSPGVTSVQASIAGYASPLQKVSSGYFALSYRVPSLPAFLHRTYVIVVTARNGRGESVSSSLPITVR